MHKKLIFFDVDGTLYDNNLKLIHPSTVLALKALKDKGHELVIASGRAYFMLYSIEEIKALFDHFVLINGQFIMANGKVIYEDTIEKAKIDALIKSMIELKITYGFESSATEAISEINDRVKGTFAEMDLNLPPENKNLHEKENIYQMWCFGSSEAIEILAKKHPDFAFIKWLTSGYDIIKKGQSKGKGIKYLSDYLGFAKEDLIAFGDGDNDIEMMENVGVSIAMGNATEKLKAVSSIVTSRIDEDGIYQALKQLDLI